MCGIYCYVHNTVTHKQHIFHIASKIGRGYNTIIYVIVFLLQSMPMCGAKETQPEKRVFKNCTKHLQQRGEHTKKK